MSPKKSPSKTSPAKPRKTQRGKSVPSPMRGQPGPAKLDAAKLLELRSSIRSGCLVHEDVAAIGQKIFAGVRLLRSNEISSAPEYQQDEHARRLFEGVGSEIVPALNGLLSNTLDAMLGIINSVKGREAENAAVSLTDNLARAIRALYREAGHERGRGLLRKAAGRRMEFPALASVILKDNEDSQKLVREHLNLGGALPFKVTPNKNYNVFSLMAMEVVMEIETARSDHWAWRQDSVYRKVAPHLDNVDFRKGAEAEILWAKAIRFHLDFFQGPRQRRKRAAEDFGLESELEHYEARRQRMDLTSFRAFGEISKLPQFKEALKTDKKAKTELGLFDRAKQKIIDRALELMPE